MKSTLPFAQYDADIDHLHILHKDIPDGVTNLYTETFVRQQQAEIEALNRKLTAYKQSNNVADTQIKALQNLVEEQDKKIVELAFRAVYAERGNEVAKELLK